MIGMAWDAGRRMTIGVVLVGSLALTACGGTPSPQGDGGTAPTGTQKVSFQSDNGREVRTSSDLGADGDDAGAVVGEGDSDETTPAPPEPDDSDDGDREPSSESANPDTEADDEPESEPEPAPMPVDARTRTISGEQSDPAPVTGTVIGSWSVRGNSVSGVTEACVYKDGKAIVVMGRRRVTGTWDSPDTKATGTIRDGNGTPILTMTMNSDDTLSWRQVDSDGRTPVGGEDVAIRTR